MLNAECAWEEAWIRSGLAGSTPLGDAWPGLETPFRPPQRRWSEHQANAWDARERDFQAQFCTLPFLPSSHSSSIQPNLTCTLGDVHSLESNYLQSRIILKVKSGLDLPTPSPSPVEICSSDRIFAQLTPPTHC
jgi:hypothetical protein